MIDKMNEERYTHSFHPKKIEEEKKRNYSNFNELCKYLYMLMPILSQVMDFSNKHNDLWKYLDMIGLYRTFPNQYTIHVSQNATLP